MSDTDLRRRLANLVELWRKRARASRALGGKYLGLLSDELDLCANELETECSGLLAAEAAPDPKRCDSHLRQLCRDLGITFAEGRETDEQLRGVLYQRFTRRAAGRDERTT